MKHAMVVVQEGTGHEVVLGLRILDFRDAGLFVKLIDMGVGVGEDDRGMGRDDKLGTALHEFVNSQ